MTLLNDEEMRLVDGATSFIVLSGFKPPAYPLPGDPPPTCPPPKPHW